MLHVIDHPVIRERLTHIRSVDSETAPFRHAMHDIARLMCFEVTQDLETKSITVETPLTKTEGHALARPVVLVPILRAGIGLVNGFSEILTEASVGYIGLCRDEKPHLPHSYYCKLPDPLSESEVILIDPMLATGGSAADAADEVKKAGATRIRFACLIAAPEGAKTMEERHPDIPIYTAALDECLDENA